MEIRKTVPIRGDAKAGIEVAGRILQSRGFKKNMALEEYTNFDNVALAHDDTFWLLAVSRITVTAGGEKGSLSLRAELDKFWMWTRYASMTLLVHAILLGLLIEVPLALAIFVHYVKKKVDRALGFLAAALKAGVEEERES